LNYKLQGLSEKLFITTLPKFCRNLQLLAGFWPLPQLLAGLAPVIGSPSIQLVESTTTFIGTPATNDIVLAIYAAVIDTHCYCKSVN